MKHLFIYIITVLIFACGSSDDGGNTTDDDSNFEISVVANSSVSIDETILITVNSNEPLNSVQVFQDNVDSGTFYPNGQSTIAKFNYSFDTVGNRTFIVKATNLNNVVRERTLTINVARGNAIKIMSFRVVSFYNIDQTWDPEFEGTDRLADVKFAFVKPKIRVFEDNYGYTTWFISSTKENQGDLNWDISSESLYIDPNFILRFGLSDDDGDFGQDLMLGPPSEREIDLSQYIASRPNTITVNYPEINLEAVLTVEWPN